MYLSSTSVLLSFKRTIDHHPFLPLLYLFIGIVCIKEERIPIRTAFILNDTHTHLSLFIQIHSRATVRVHFSLARQQTCGVIFLTLCPSSQQAQFIYTIRSCSLAKKPQEYHLTQVSTCQVSLDLIAAPINLALECENSDACLNIVYGFIYSVHSSFGTGAWFPSVPGDLSGILEINKVAGWKDFKTLFGHSEI